MQTDHCVTVQSAGRGSLCLSAFDLMLVLADYCGLPCSYFLYSALLRVAKAVGDPGCPATELVEVLGQACYERHICDLQHRGINIVTSSITPAPGQFGSSPASSLHHTDHQHKFKRWLCFVRNQQSQLQPKLLISREAVVAANVQLINSLMQPHTEHQCVAFENAFFSMVQLKDALHEQGDHCTALVLELAGRADMAWDMSGLTHLERLGRFLTFKHMLLTVLAPTAASLVQKGKGHVLGMPRDLLWAMLHNVDS